MPKTQHKGHRSAEIATKSGWPSKGKRGSARVITCVIALQESVTLLSIFDKADQATISDQELDRLLTENDLA